MDPIVYLVRTFSSCKSHNRQLESCLAGLAVGKLPRAILPPQRTFWGAILDVIVGDGPSKR